MEHRLRSYAFSILVMSVLYCIILLHHNAYNFDYPYDICSSFGVWLIVGILLYIYVPNPIH